MAKVLVTGGAGLIGSFLLEELHEGGHDVTVIDDLSRGYARNVPASYRFLEIDAKDINAHDIGDFEVIFHLASFMFGLGFSANNHARLYYGNAVINEAMVDFVSRHPPKRFVYVSSSCVYSDEGEDVVSEETLLGEFPEKANIGYGFAKRHMEDCLSMAAVLGGFELSVVRPFNIYGERYRWAGDLSQAIPMLVNKVMTETKVDVWGSGRQRRTYIHAKDCARLLYRVGFDKAQVKVLNIGNLSTISLNELTAKIAQVAGREIRIENDVTRPEGRFVKSCSTRELEKLFPNFKFEISLDEGLARMVEWWREEVASN